MAHEQRTGLMHGYLLDGKGGAKSITLSEAATWQPAQGLLWLHFDYTHPGTLKWFKEASGLDDITQEALLAEDTRPRCTIDHDSIMIFLRGMNLNPGQDPEDMVSVRLYVTEHRIISTRKRRLLSVEDICHALEHRIGPRNAQEFLLQLNDRLTDRIADVIDTLEDDVDALEEAVLDAESRLLRPKISDARRQAILIRRYLAPQREALMRLQLENTKLISAKGRLHLREQTDRIIRYIEDLDMARDRATIVQEELTSKISDQLDRRMYMLSIVAVIFLPLTFVTGLLGINVGGVPGVNSHYAFWVVCGLLFVLLIGLVGFLRRWRWM